MFRIMPNKIAVALVLISSALTARAEFINDRQVINVKEYGAVGDNATNDSNAIKAALAAAITSGKPLYFPTAIYNVGTSQLVFLLNSALTSGVYIYGDGVARSIINAMNVTTSPQVLFTNTEPPSRTAWNFSIKEIGFYNYTTGAGVQFGNEDFSDSFQKPTIDILALNFHNASTARAVEMNSVANGKIRLVANVATNGTGLLLRQATYNHFTGSVGAVAGTSIRLTDGANKGNVFMAMDMENVDTCIISDSPANEANTFIGGTFSYMKNGVISTAGKGLIIINPGTNPAPPGTLAGFAGASTGLTIIPAKL